MRFLACSVTLLLFSLTPSLAGTFRHDRSNSQHIALGLDPRYESVGRFDWNESGFEFIASGVLISPEWVLTAGHVVGGTDNAGGGISDFRFTTANGLAITAAEWIAHHNWTATGGSLNLFAGWDLGLVRLSQPVADLTPAELYQGQDELGHVGTIVGYGRSGTGLTGSTEPAGIRRAGTNSIDAIGRTQLPGGNHDFDYTHDRLLSTDFDNPLFQGDSRLGSVFPLDLEYDTGGGDSGGGLFIEVGGRTLVAGITSLGRGNDTNPVNSDYGDISSYTRVSSFIDWIEAETGLDLSAPILGAAQGDFNGDGIISIADYNRWRLENGRSVGVLTADANGDGQVDAADYTMWRDAYGQALASGSQASAAAVPEPGAVALLAILAPFAAGRQRHER